MLLNIAYEDVVAITNLKNKKKEKDPVYKHIFWMENFVLKTRTLCVFSKDKKTMCLFFLWASQNGMLLME